MTLISFACYGDHAEVVTDSLAYTSDFESIITSTKISVLPHIDALAIGQGDSEFTGIVKTAMSFEAVSTFDDMLTGKWLDRARSLWPQIVADAEQYGRSGLQATVYLVGRSEAAGEFVAYMFAAEQDFKAIRINHPHVTPAPLKYRISGMERRRMWAERDSYGEEDFDKLLDGWALAKRLPAPASDQDWIDLAELVYEHRCLSNWPAYGIGGELRHTRISRGEIHIRSIHTFPDDDDNFDRMVLGSSHPRAFAQPCYCGSGLTLGECCNTISQADDDR